jgi:hypothetical protein
MTNVDYSPKTQHAMPVVVSSAPPAVVIESHDINVGTGEKIFFNERNTIVTNARYVLPSKKTVVVSNIDLISNGTIEEKTNYIGESLISIGLIALFYMLSIGIGLMSVGLVVKLLTKRRRYYLVHVRTSSGELASLKDQNKDFILRITAALNEAIAHKASLPVIS